jgi:probable HAF family extracellular repeat protein
MQPGGLSPRDLGTLGGPDVATALNIWGQVVGYSLETYNGDLDFLPEYGVLYAGGKVTNLGLPASEVSPYPIFESYALAINDYGQIVGLTDVTISAEDPRGMLYMNGQMYDLNNLIGTTGTSLTITEAIGINDFGQILCNASVFQDNYSEHAVILTPIRRFRP